MKVLSWVQSAALPTLKQEVSSDRASQPNYCMHISVKDSCGAFHTFLAKDAVAFQVLAAQALPPDAGCYREYPAVQARSLIIRFHLEIRRQS